MEKRAGKRRKEEKKASFVACSHRYMPCTICTHPLPSVSVPTVEERERELDSVPPCPSVSVSESRNMSRVQKGRSPLNDFLCRAICHACPSRRPRTSDCQPGSQPGQAAVQQLAAGNFDVRESPPGSPTTRSNFAAAPPSLRLLLRPPCLCLVPESAQKRKDALTSPFFSRALVPRPVWVGRVVIRHPCPCSLGA
jgi:hypothetical protein